MYEILRCGPIMVSKNFDDRLHNQEGEFSLGKLNVILDCFCSQPVGTLIDSMRGNPDIRASRNGAWLHAENLVMIPLKGAPFCGGSGPTSN